MFSRKFNQDSKWPRNFDQSNPSADQNNGTWDWFLVKLCCEYLSFNLAMFYFGLRNFLLLTQICRIMKRTESEAKHCRIKKHLPVVTTNIRSDLIFTFTLLGSQNIWIESTNYSVHILSFLWILQGVPAKQIVGH